NEDAAMMTSAAKVYRDETIKNADNEAIAAVSLSEAAARERAEQLIKRRATLAALNSRKNFLAAKRSLVEDVFARAEKKLEAMSADDRLALIDKLIARHAEEGDIIVISKNAPFSASDAEGLPAAKRLSLKAQKTGDFSGGIILSGRKFDKDLTFSALVAAAKEKEETMVAEELFGK
ncbi:MAG: hypothetical protein ILP02_04600, partial [Clostridia bacterium]|nr:hypothetical protein [Clostridia bacterium]